MEESELVVFPYMVEKFEWVSEESVGTTSREDGIDDVDADDEQSWRYHLNQY